MALKTPNLLNLLNLDLLNPNLLNPNLLNLNLLNLNVKGLRAFWQWFPCGFVEYVAKSVMRLECVFEGFARMCVRTATRLMLGSIFGWFVGIFGRWYNNLEIYGLCRGVLCRGVLCRWGRGGGCHLFVKRRWMRIQACL